MFGMEGGGLGVSTPLLASNYCALVQHEVPFLKKSVRSKNSGR